MSEASYGNAGVVIVDARHPWLGLLPFKEAHADYFFGRDAEIVEILERIQENSLTVLFGQSGLGKSSLLGAGVIPRLAASGHAPVPLRLAYDSSTALVEQTREAIRQALPSAAWPADAGTISLWELFHRLPLLLPVDAPKPVILFDQFEEIFTLGRQQPEREAEVEEWLEQIADLLQNRPPKALEDRFAENRRLAREFDFGRCPLRVVFAMREDYLSYLEQWKTRLPLLTQNRMALQLLDGPQALEAVLGPASLSEQPLLTREVAAGIVRTVAQVPGDTPLNRIKAVPPLLSLLCEQLNAARLSASAQEITAEMVSDQSADILQRFYEESYAVFPESQREIIREIVEDRMVTIGGHRHPVVREDAEIYLLEKGVQDPRGVFDALIAHRLLTTEEHGGLQRLEVTHDVLVPLLVRSRKARRDRVAKEMAEQKLAEEKALTQKRLQLLAGAGLLTVLALAGAIYGLFSSREAKLQRDEARYNEGLGWMLRAEVAEERKNQYPDTLLYAAQAIGFDGVGRPDDAPEGLLRFIRQDRNPESYIAARRWISNRPAYVPVWSSAAYPSPVTSLDVSPDGRWLALGTADGSVRLWDFLENKEAVVTPPGDDPVLNVVFHPWGASLAIATKEHIRHWDLGKSSLGSEDNRNIACYGLGPGGTVEVSSTHPGSLDLMEGGDTTHVTTGEGMVASSFSFGADDSTIAALFPGVGIRLVFTRHRQLANAWSRLDGKTAAFLINKSEPALDALARYVSQTTAIVMRPDGQVLVTGGQDGAIGLWDTASARLIGQASQEHRHSGAVLGLAFRPDGLQFASASEDGMIRLWTVSQENVPAIVATLVGHCGSVTALRYLPGGDLLASAGSDGSCRLWNVSGKTAESQDLYTYFKQEWYRFNPAARQAIASAGGWGIANIPAGSITDIWMHGGTQAFTYLMSVGEWNGAVALSTLPSIPEVTAALLDDANDAAESNRWSRVELRLGQLKRMGSDAGAELERRKAVLFEQGMPLKNTEGIEMLWCPPGQFLMGSPDNEAGRAAVELRHRVTITHGFWLGKFELTQPQWMAIAGDNPSTYTSEKPMAPVENISWYDAMEYCRLLTDRERARGTIPPGWEYTLPTEAQWEYACRAGTETAYAFGESPQDLHRFGNFNDKRGGFSTGAGSSDPSQDDGNQFPAPVGSYLPNGWGFHDMHGNLFEWCRDSISIEKFSDAVYPAGDAVDPLGTAGKRRVNRGGGFYFTANWSRSASRNTDVPESRDFSCGVRLALVPITVR